MADKPRTRIVPSSELTPKTLLARDYVPKDPSPPKEQPIEIPFRPNELPVMLDAFECYRRDLERRGEQEPPELAWLDARINQARESHAEHKRRRRR